MHASELIRLRNRITALEANGSELLARAERAEAVVAALPDPSTAEELREKITELLGSPDEALLDAFLGYAWSETARIAGGEMTARWQAEDERDQLKRGGKELGKVVDFLGDLIKAAYQRGADDPIDAVHMLGNCLAELLEGEGGLPTDEHNRVYRALEDQRAKQDAPRTPESTADAPSPVSAATEAHGEAEGAEEAPRWLHDLAQASLKAARDKFPEMGGE